MFVGVFALSLGGISTQLLHWEQKPAQRNVNINDF